MPRRGSYNTDMIPDWQLPPGVDRGLWDYLHSHEMVTDYDRQMAASTLAAVDVRFCEEQFPKPGRLIDLGCGTGRLCRQFAAKGFECVGVDLSDEMLAKAREINPGTTFVTANLVDLAPIADESCDYAACLFSTLGMVRGPDHRRSAVRSAYRVLKPGGRFVVHVHNRGFHRLGRRRFRTGDITMSQAYGGAPLTLYHFRKVEIVELLRNAGFVVRELRPVGLSETGRLANAWLLPGLRAYGYLLAADKPTPTP